MKELQGAGVSYRVEHSCVRLICAAASCCLADGIDLDRAEKYGGLYEELSDARAV